MSSHKTIQGVAVLDGETHEFSIEKTTAKKMHK